MKELNEGRTARDEGMDVDEFLTWIAYARIEPFPETRADVHTGMLMAQQYNMNRGKDAQAKSAADFMPRWYTPPVEVTADGIAIGNAMRTHFIAQGGDPEVFR